MPFYGSIQPLVSPLCSLDLPGRQSKLSSDSILDKVNDRCNLTGLQIPHHAASSDKDAKSTNLERTVVDHHTQNHSLSFHCTWCRIHLHQSLNKGKQNKSFYKVGFILWWFLWWSFFSVLGPFCSCCIYYINTWMKITVVIFPFIYSYVFFFYTWYLGLCSWIYMEK